MAIGPKVFIITSILALSVFKDFGQAATFPEDKDAADLGDRVAVDLGLDQVIQKTGILDPKEKNNPKYFGSLRTTFSIDPTKGFNEEPRLRSDAEKIGFRLFASGCDGTDRHKLPGYHLVEDNKKTKRGKDNKKTKQGGEIALIYDKNGYIAGMRSITPIVSPCDPDKTYVSQSFVQREQVHQNGPESYLTTVYFVHPSKVCTGRNSTEFQEQGTGTGLYIVNGSTINDLNHMPSFASETDTATPKMYKLHCGPNMGNHYLFHNMTDKTSLKPDCSDIPGFQILYATQPPHELIGFVIYISSTPPGARWEPFSIKMLERVVGNRYPPCIAEQSRKGIARMHVYLRNYRQKC